MGLATMTQDQFIATLNAHLHPSSPIRQEALLRGRAEQLDQIRKALASPGRNVFVYGLRGVGKTSLAQTAAYVHQSSDSEPVLVACDPKADFYSLIQSIGSKLLRQVPTQRSKSKTSKLGAGARFLTFEMSKAIEEGQVPKPSSVDEAIGIVGYCAHGHSRVPVIVVDEFERLANKNDRMLFGDFTKQIGDQGVGVK